MRLSHGKDPLISVILPVYNAEQTIGAALESIRAQSLENWELIVVDDGSLDTTGEIVSWHSRQDERIHLHSRGHRGIVQALNAGFQLSSAPFLARMDADDVSHPERLALQHEYLCSHPEIDLVSCLLNYGGREKSGYSLYVDWLNQLQTPEALLLNRFIESPVAHPSVVFRRKWAERHGAYREGAFPEDYELWLRWCDAGMRMGKVQHELLVWNDPPGRLSRTHPRYSTEAFYRLKVHYLARWMEKNLPGNRALWLWGAGRISRKRFAALESKYRPFDGFVDIDPQKIGGNVQGRPVVSPKAIPPDAFILTAVGNRGAREKIRRRLLRENQIEGVDFLCAA